MAVAAGVCVATGAFADALVVKSVGPSARAYPPGRSIPDSTRIVLQANDQLVLLDGRGTRTLRGPGAFTAASPSSGGTASRSTLAALATRSSDRRVRIGAVRGAPTGPVRPPNIWTVDLAKSGTICVADPAAVQLWRASAAEAGTTTLYAPSGERRTLSWARGQALAPWPADLPIAAGGAYRLSGVGAAGVTMLSFAMLQPAPAGLEDTASALIRYGCSAQLDLLVETVSVPDAGSAG